MFYRYRNLNKKTISALENDEFWISSCDTFNDLFDVQIAYNRENIKQEFFYNNAIRKSYIEYKNKYHYSLKTEDEIFLSYIDYICQCFISNIKRKVLICSMTLIDDNAVMWSHYAGDSRGFVAGYEREDIEKMLGGSINKTCFKVEYDKGPFDSTNLIIESVVSGIQNDTFNMEKAYHKFEYLMINGDCDKHFYLRKTKEWQYEEEYRFMRYYGPSTGDEHQMIGHIRPSKIIIGYKMPIQDKINIYRLCLEKVIPLFKAEVSWDINNYRIVVSPFTADDLKDVSILIEDEIKKYTQS